MRSGRGTSRNIARDLQLLRAVLQSSRFLSGSTECKETALGTPRQTFDGLPPEVWRNLIFLLMGQERLKNRSQKADLRWAASRKSLYGFVSLDNC